MATFYAENRCFCQKILNAQFFIHDGYIDLTVFSRSGNILSYSPNEKLNMSVFLPHQKSRSVFAVNPSIDKALFDERCRYLEKRAAEGDRNAQFSLGLFHSRGLKGQLQSDQKALHWYLSAAKQGLAEAQYQVGLFAIKGKGGLAVSDVEAAYWFRLAAKGGNAKAQFMMGNGCEHGIAGLPQSNQDALYWYKLAADQGLERAIDRIRELSKTQTTLVSKQTP